MGSSIRSPHRTPFDGQRDVGNVLERVGRVMRPVLKPCDYEGLESDPNTLRAALRLSPEVGR